MENQRIWNSILEALRHQPISRKSPLGTVLLGQLVVPFTLRLCRTAAVPVDERSYENATWILRHLIIHGSYVEVYNHFNEEGAEDLLEMLQDFGTQFLDDQRATIRECGVLIVVGSVLCSVRVQKEWGWFTQFLGEGFTLFPQRASLIATLITWFSDVEWVDFVNLYLDPCLALFSPTHPRIWSTMLDFYVKYYDSNDAKEHAFGQIFCNALHNRLQD